MSIQVKISEIDRDPILKVRRRIDKDAVLRYVGCATLPPIDVFKINGKLKLAGGWHRLVAAEKRGDSHIEANVHRGSIAEAEAFALCDNAKHGMPLSADERDDAISRLHELKWSTRKIAEELSIGHTTVARALKTTEVYQMVQSAGIKGVKQAAMRAIAETPRPRWEDLATATSKHRWSPDEIKLAAQNLADKNLSDTQKARVLKTGAPVAYDAEGEPALISDTVTRVVSEKTPETTAAMKFGEVEAAIRKVCNNWSAEKIIDGIAKFGEKDLNTLLEELPEEIAMLQAVLDEANSRRAKLKLVAG